MPPCMLLVLSYVRRSAGGAEGDGPHPQARRKAVIVDLLPARSRGFPPADGPAGAGIRARERFETMLKTAGLGVTRAVTAAARSRAKGPALFLASARRSNCCRINLRNSIGLADTRRHSVTKENIDDADTDPAGQDPRAPRRAGIQGARPARRPTGAARRSCWPSRRCRA